MKAELTFPQELVDQIAEKVIERLTPMLNGDNSESDTILDVQGLSDYLKVKKQWVYEKVHQGSIPYYKVGKYPRFRKPKIDEWLIKMEKGNGGKSKNTVRRLLEGSA
jgi:excisionase family DNA binding protein